MFRYNGVQLSEFSQGVIRFFGEHGDALSDDAWRTFHRWYHAAEMNKCVADFEEGLELEYTTVEFAAELGVSARTIEGWRISRRGKPPKLPADHTDERGRAVYTTEQLENARALLQRNQKTTASTTAESMSEPTTDDKPVEENHAAQIESTATIEAVTELIIDDEFKALIPPLADNERAQLEENLLRDGIRDPLVVWQGYGIIVDGHNRYSIAQAHGLPFKTREIDFADRDAVKLWIVQNQFGRRNVNRFGRGELALKLEPSIAAQAKANQGTRTDINFLSTLTESCSIDTRTELAKIAGVSTGTMAKIKYLVEAASDEVKVALRADDLTINRAYSAVKAGAVTVEDVLNFKPDRKTESPSPKLPEPAREVDSSAAEIQATNVQDDSPVDSMDNDGGNGEVVGGEVKRVEKKAQIADAKVEIAAQIVDEPEKPTLFVGDGIGFVPDEPYKLLLTDPPYSTDVDDVAAFAESWLPNALRHVRRDGFAYVFIGAYPDELKAYLNVTTPENISLCQVLVWTYRNTLGNNPRDRYKQNWQACLFYRGVDAPDLDCPLTSEQWAVQDINAPDGRLGNRYHTWQKPDEIAERFIRHATRPGDTVFDPFACTGTFLIAAAKLGRKGYGFELDADNAKIAFERGCRQAKKISPQTPRAEGNQAQ